MIPTYAVLPSLGRECLTDCLESFLPQIDLLFLVRTEEYGIPEIADDRLQGRIVVIDDLIRPRNIQRWWNLGITAAEAQVRMLGQKEWNALVINDDVIAPPHLSAALSAAMRDTSAILAYPDPAGTRSVLLTTPSADTSTRITGWCFMIRGESGLMADEQFEWWYGDNDIDWTARGRGGSLLVPGCAVRHLYPGGTTSASAELTARTHVDRRLFEAKWSGLPH